MLNQNFKSNKDYVNLKVSYEIQLVGYLNIRLIWIEDKGISLSWSPYIHLVFRILQGIQ